MSPKARFMVRIVMAVVGLLAGLILGELGLRVGAAMSPEIGRRLTDPLGILVEPYGEWGFRQKPGSVFEYPEWGVAAHANRSRYRGPVVSAPKPAGTVRVVLLGGSATHGWGVADSATIDTYMREILSARSAERAFDVVNLAFDAYDSWQMYERLSTDGIPLEPDVVIMNAGINDVRNGHFPNLQDRDPRTMIWEGALSDLREGARRGRVPLWLRVKHHLYLARVPALLRELLEDRRPITDRTSEKAYPDAIDYFEQNVRRVADLALSEGAALILSTPPSSLTLNYPPDATSHRGYWIRDAELTQEYRDSLAARMRSVADDLASHNLRVRYVRPAVPGHQFLDDAHLTAEGNRLIAEAWADEVMTLIEG